MATAPPMRSLIHIALIACCAAPLTGAFVSLKLIPQVLILVLLYLSIALHQSVKEAPWKGRALAPSLLLILLCAPVVLLIQGLLWIAPPVTADGHPVMAIGQIASGGALGLLIGLLFNYLYFFRFTRDPRLETRMVCAVAFVFTSGFILDRVLELI